MTVRGVGRVPSGVGGDGPAQGVGRAQLRAAGQGHRGVPDAHAAPAGGLGLGHGLLRGGEQVHAGAARGPLRDADAHPERPPGAAPTSCGGCEHREQADGDVDDRGGVGQQDGELVPAQAGDLVAAAHGRAQPRGDLGEDRVPRGPAVGGVEGAEPVEPEVQQRRAGTPRGAASRWAATTAALNPAPVEQPRHRVGLGGGG